MCIRDSITPYPSFILTPEREDGKDILVLSVSSGRSTPYYYKADGIMAVSYTHLDVYKRQVLHTDNRHCNISHLTLP